MKFGIWKVYLDDDCAYVAAEGCPARAKEFKIGFNRSMRQAIDAAVAHARGLHEMDEAARRLQNPCAQAVYRALLIPICRRILVARSSCARR